MGTGAERSYLVIEGGRFGLVFAKTVSIISGTVLVRSGLMSTLLKSWNGPVWVDDSGARR